MSSQEISLAQTWRTSPLLLHNFFQALLPHQVKYLENLAFVSFGPGHTSPHILSPSVSLLGEGGKWQF